jgi:hypothetical protein
MVYHVGFSKRGNTMVIEACRDIDYMSCELYDYMGKRETTKRSLHDNRYQILDMMKKQKPGVYGNLTSVVVGR